MEYNDLPGETMGGRVQMDSTEFFQRCYQYGLWIFTPLIILGVYLLFFFIVKVIRVIKNAHVVSLPLVEEQDVEFVEAGRLVLSGEGPLITFRFAGLKYSLTAANGMQVPSRSTLFRAKTSGFTSSRMEFRIYSIPEPGRYTLQVEGLGEAKPTDAQHHLRFGHMSCR